MLQWFVNGFGAHKAIALHYINISLRSYLKQGNGRLRSRSLILQDTFNLGNFSSLGTKGTTKSPSYVNICTCKSVLLLNIIKTQDGNGQRP